MIFIDTGAFLGRYLPADQHHQESVEGWGKLTAARYRCYTSSFVVDETLTLLGRRASYAFAAERARRIYASKMLEVLRPDEDDETRALSYFEKFADQKVSFTDCVSFVLMKRYRLHFAFSFDRHFELAGFAPWLGPKVETHWLHEPRAPYG